AARVDDEQRRAAGEDVDVGAEGDREAERAVRIPVAAAAGQRTLARRRVAGDVDDAVGDVDVEGERREVRRVGMLEVGRVRVPRTGGDERVGRAADRVRQRVGDVARRVDVAEQAGRPGERVDVDVDVVRV